MNWYWVAFKNYAEFKGRARRKEYWYFTLFNAIAYILWIMIDASARTGGVIGLIYSLSVFLPSLGVSIRRLHDTDHSGWWLLLALIPILGAMALIFFMVKIGTPGDNRFGKNPIETTP